MAIQHNVAGLVTVKVDTGATNALESLGYSLNGVEITEETFMGDVHSDENGGEQGPPVDIQYFGEVHRIRMVLSKYDPAVAAKIQRLYGGTAGTPGAVGTLLFAAGKSYRLLLACTSEPRNYLQVVFRDPIELNKGTKYSQLVLVGTAYKNASGVMWNSTVV